MHGNAARRQFLKTSGMGLGAAVLGSLFGRTAEASQHASSAFARSDNPLSTPGPGTRDGLHHPASAKRVIFLFMAGAPSQIDLFDEKPQLADRFQQPLPKEVSNGQRVTAMTRGREQLIAPSMFQFAPAGQSGLRIS
ncbi:MAG: DUF1501 domain-containing protein [Planctomycetota bacterium]